MTYKLTVTTLALTAITSTVAATHTKPDTEHPHIVLILCDDMGFSDLSLDELSFTVWHTPGHTEGSVVLLCENYLFVGDTVFQDRKSVV